MLLVDLLEVKTISVALLRSENCFWSTPEGILTDGRWVYDTAV